ncbi:hypothetical protein BAE44_0001914, partial [Dichanthelium oligosanthes]
LLHIWNSTKKIFHQKEVYEDFWVARLSPFEGQEDY